MTSHPSNRNFALPIVEKGGTNQNKLDFPLISRATLLVAVFLGIVAVFEIGIPSVIMLFLSMFIFLPLISKTVVSPLPALMALIVYIPYSKAISGNLGGIIPGLNFTTVLMMIVVLGLYLRSRAIPLESPEPLERSFRNVILLFCIFGALAVIHTIIACADCTLFEEVVFYKRWLDPFLVFFLFSYLVRTPEEGKTLIYLMVVSLTIIGIGSIWLHHVTAEQDHLVRLRGLEDQSNQMGAFYSNYMFFILGFLFMKGIGSIRKGLFALGAWGFLLGLFATMSRGDMLGLVGGLLLFFFLRNRLLLLVIMTGIAFLAINIQFLPEGLRARVERSAVVHNDPYNMDHSTQLDASARTRLAIWTGAVRMIMDHPVEGVGLKMFPQYIYDYVPHNEETSHLDLLHRDGHNAYLMVAAEMGLPAFIVFLALLVYMIRIPLQSYRTSPDPFWKAVSVSTLCAVASLIITNMFGSRLISLILTGYLWGTFAILLKLPKWTANQIVENTGTE